MAEQEKLTTTAWGRFLKMGALAGKVGFSLVGEKALGLFLSDDSREMRMAKSWAKNAEKIAETLGQLKGGAMKIGQMLSIQEALLPKELTFVLKSLQNNAPTISADTMFQTLDADIPHWRTLIKSIDHKPLAAASIGQVHRATMLDGREVAVKIQYPKIDEVIFSDLKNLRRLFELILESVMSANLTHLFTEIEARLSEEVDYRREKTRLEEFRRFYTKNPKVSIPKPVPELSSQRVLTTELLLGLSIEEARHYPQEKKNEWGILLFQSLVEQLLVFRKLQSDPNPANYAFKKDSGIILYDFGSIKELPDWLHQGYMGVVQIAREGQFEKIATILASMQISLKNGDKIPQHQIDFFYETLSPIFTNKPFRFTKTTEPIQKIVAYNKSHFDELKNIAIPGDVLFIDRAFMGLCANLTALEAEAHWGDVLLNAIDARV
ncbi:MAG TPA: AarF/ABC1/UbiB kinase family protein [Turneriella sp.]|nr:AarF/ABC1/UbiB kinase family protein [Turneriella sp.]